MPPMDDDLYDLIWSILSYCLSKASFFFILVCLFDFGGDGGGVVGWLGFCLLS